jgi:hypothetical protein
MSNVEEYYDEVPEDLELKKLLEGHMLLHDKYTAEMVATIKEMTKPDINKDTRKKLRKQFKDLNAKLITIAEQQEREFNDYMKQFQNGGKKYKKMSTTSKRRKAITRRRKAITRRRK